MNPVTLRPTTAEDLPGLSSVLEATELFPSALLPEMIAPFLAAQETALWITCSVAGRVVGFGYAEPEPMTEGTWNLRAIAMHPEVQGNGLGGKLLASVEARLREGGGRLLLVDTSGQEAFAPARRFYLRNGYREEARIGGFWAPGDDKVTFTKVLRA